MQMSNSMGDMNILQADRSTVNTPCDTPHGNANTASPGSMGMIPNSLLISHASNVSSTSAFANGTARLSGIPNDLTASAPAGVGDAGAAAGAGLVGLDGMTGAGLDGTWMWTSGSLGGSGGVTAGPSCITTGMQD